MCLSREMFVNRKSGEGYISLINFDISAATSLWIVVGIFYSITSQHPFKQIKGLKKFRDAYFIIKYYVSMW
jgi:hypothetical protein